MPKNVLQDMVKVKKAQPPKVKTEEPFILKERYNNPKEQKGGSRYLLWFVAFGALIFLFFGIVNFFSNAKIIINPKVKEFALGRNFTATKNGGDQGTLAYDTIILTGEEEKKVLAGPEKYYKEYANGTILLYNTFSKDSQELNQNTKLEGSNGKIYKTNKKVSIPGMTSTKTPGKVSVDIVAENYGEKYNSDPIDLKILNFKGTSKYDKFYGRSVGKIAGGIDGISRRLEKEEQDKIVNELKENLNKKLFQKAKDQTPKEFVLLKDASFLEVDEETISDTDSDGGVTVKIKGTFYGFLFKEKDLSKKIIEVAFGEGDSSDAYVQGIQDLKFSIEGKDKVIFIDNPNINFSLSGNLKIISFIDEEKIISEVVGKDKKNLDEILSAYKNIDSVETNIKPIWKNSFPENKEKIKIIVNYP